MLATSKSLNSELVSLFSYVTRLREEIASINRGQGGTEQFKSMSDQLDAIVGATEEATNTIMESMEGNETAVRELRKSISDPDRLSFLIKLSKTTVTSFRPAPSKTSPAKGSPRS